MDKENSEDLKILKNISSYLKTIASLDDIYGMIFYSALPLIWYAVNYFDDKYLSFKACVEGGAAQKYGWKKNKGKESLYGWSSNMRPKPGCYAPYIAIKNPYVDFDKWGNKDLWEILLKQVKQIKNHNEKFDWKTRPAINALKAFLSDKGVDSEDLIDALQVLDYKLSFESEMLFNWLDDDVQRLRATLSAIANSLKNKEYCSYLVQKLVEEYNDKNTEQWVAIWAKWREETIRGTRPTLEEIDDCLMKWVHELSETGFLRYPPLPKKVTVEKMKEEFDFSEIIKDEQEADRVQEDYAQLRSLVDFTFDEYGVKRFKFKAASEGLYIVRNREKITQEQLETYFRFRWLAEQMSKPEDKSWTRYDLYYKMIDQSSETEDKEVLLRYPHDNTSAAKPRTTKSKISNELLESSWWKKAMMAGLVDENGQPTGSRTEAAILADVLLEKMKKEHEWTVFEKLWNRKNMRTDFQDAKSLVKYHKVREKIVKLLS